METKDNKPLRKKSRKKKDKDRHTMVLQGYDFSTAKYKMTLYEKRMMLGLVEAAQQYIEGVRHIAGKSIVIDVKQDRTTITLPIDMILHGDPRSLTYALRQATVEFTKRAISYTGSDGRFVVFSPVTMCEIPAQCSYIQIEVHQLFWNAVLDFKRGYRKFDAGYAMGLKSVYSIRFYEMMSGCKESLTYRLDKLKEMFCLKNKYALTADFVRKVIEPAKRELDKAAPYSFDYQAVKEGKKIVAFTFFPVHHAEHEDERCVVRGLQRRLSPSWSVPDRRVREYIRDTLEFNEAEFKNNMETFSLAYAILPDLLLVLSDLKGKCRAKDNYKGWIIQALKGKIADALGKQADAPAHGVQDCVSSLAEKLSVR